MKLLFIFTGGTIGSTKEQGVISAKESKAYAILSAYERKYGIDFEYEVAEPYTEVSENNTGVHIKKLCDCVKDACRKDYDGIIVTHGSDTLQYSAAAIGYCIGLCTPPVCLVAANAPIEDKCSNALDNLRGAVRFVEERAGQGAFAVYRNASGDRVRVHRATRLIGSAAYTDELMSVKNCVFGEFDGNFNFIGNPDYYELPDGTEPFDCRLLNESNEEALVLFSYPAMTYPRIGENVKYVIFNTYHSGTLNTVSDAALRFFASARERGIPVFATGAEKGLCYSSSAEFDRLGIIPLYNISPVAAYIKLWLAHSWGRELKTAVNIPLSGDLPTN